MRNIQTHEEHNIAITPEWHCEDLGRFIHRAKLVIHYNNLSDHSGQIVNKTEYARSLYLYHYGPSGEIENIYTNPDILEQISADLMDHLTTMANKSGKASTRKESTLNPYLAEALF